jgi:uncharacterized membrane protein
MQGRVVGEAEIVAKPDDAGGSGFAGHRVVNSAGAYWVRARTAGCNFIGADTYSKSGCAEKRRRPPMNRYTMLYLATLIVIVPIDFLFLGIVAKGFFTSQVGDMLGEIRLAPAILFYLLYVVGILIFVSGTAGATWQSTLLYGALFGFFCYATFELTSLSLLKHWT